MTFPANQAGHGGWSPLRAVTVVIALYAFVLHAVLGGLVPMPSAPAHGVLCLGQIDDAASGTDAPDAGQPAKQDHAHAPCCTVPAPALDAVLPQLAVLAVAWPPRNAKRVAWRSAASIGARGPPGTIAHPRGPPLL